MIVPTLRVGMLPVTLCVTLAHGLSVARSGGTQSVPGGVSTQSVGTIRLKSQASCKQMRYVVTRTSAFGQDLPSERLSH